MKIKIIGILFLVQATFICAQKINLLDWYPYAVTESKQVFINPTDNGSKPYLGMGWGPIDSEQISGRWIVGQKATLLIYFNHVQDRHLFICARGLPAVTNQQLELYFNEMVVDRVIVNSTYTIYHFAVPVSYQKEKENKITLSFSVFSKLLASDEIPKGVKKEIPVTAGVRWISLSVENNSVYKPDSSDPTDFLYSDAPSPSVVIKSSQKIELYQKIPSQAKLQFTIKPYAGPKSKMPELELAIQNNTTSRTYSFMAKNSGKEITVPLTEFENTISRISFSLPEKNNSKITPLILMKPRITFKQNFTAVGKSDEEKISKAKGAIHDFNVIIIVLDAAAANHFKSYSYSRQTTPFLDNLASRSILMNNAFSNASYTLASSGSLFTGLLPMSHGIIDQHDALPDDAELLSESFHNAGFKTAGFGGNYFISHIFGFNQGFDYLYEPPVQDILMHSAMIVDEAKKWIESQKKNKFFMYIHFREPHVPYLPLKPYDTAFWNKASVPVTHQELKSLKCNDLHQRTPEAIEFIISQYDGLLLYIDSLIQKFYDNLKAQGLLEKTIIIVLADHGQSFWKHSIHTHSLQVFDDTIKIPMIFNFPQSLQVQPRTINTLADTIDIYPTLLDLFSIISSHSLPGTSLKNCLLINRCEDKEFIISRNESSASTMYALRNHSYKFILQRDKNIVELFDVVHDPDELHNVARKNPLISAYFSQELQKAFADSVKFRYFSPVQSLLTGEIMEKLKALGYVD